MQFRLGKVGGSAGAPSILGQVVQRERGVLQVSTIMFTRKGKQEITPIFKGHPSWVFRFQHYFLTGLPFNWNDDHAYNMANKGDLLPSLRPIESRKLWDIFSILDQIGSRAIESPTLTMALRQFSWRSICGRLLGLLFFPPKLRLPELLCDGDDTTPLPGRWPTTHPDLPSGSSDRCGGVNGSRLLDWGFFLERSRKGTSNPISGLCAN